jgi:hypothetical protein
MNTDEENNEWKAEAPYLASLPAENPFLVPEHYFDTLPAAIINSVDVNELKQVAATSGYTVPDQYFSSLKDRILAKTSALSTASQEESTDDLKLEEERFGLYNLDEQSIGDEDYDAGEVLKRFPATAGFSTPDQYFEKLQSRILAQTAGETAPVRPSKIIRLWHSGLLKYASAACFILVAAFGFYLNKQSYQPVAATTAEIANEQMLYDINEQDIIDQIEGTVATEPKNNASNAELETYILNHYSQSELSSEL